MIHYFRFNTNYNSYFFISGIFVKWCEQTINKNVKHNQWKLHSREIRFCYGMDRLPVNNSSWRPPGCHSQQSDDQQPSKIRHFAHNTFPATIVISASEKIRAQNKMPRNTITTGIKSSLLQSDNKNGGKPRRCSRSSYHVRGDIGSSLSCFIVLSCVFMLFFSSQVSTVSAQVNPGRKIIFFFSLL